VRNLTLDDLDLGLRDLFDTRKANLDLLVASKIYVPQLLEKRAGIEALPEVFKGGRPHGQKLGEVDARHDGFGTGIWCYTEALLIAPDVPEATRERALRVRDAFVPERSELSDSYAEEAAAAKKRRTKLSELEQDLKLLPLPDGKTLQDWAMGFLDEGDTLDKLLRDRASIESNVPMRDHAGVLRGSTLGVLNRFRGAVRDELTSNKALPRDLESKIFAYFDELSARRKRKKKSDDEQGPPGGGGGGGAPGGAPPGA